MTETTDDLEKKAEISSDKVVKAYGTHSLAQCSKCFREVDYKQFRECFDKGEVMVCPYLDKGAEGLAMKDLEDQIGQDCN